MEQSNFAQDLTAYGEAGMMAVTVYITVISGYLISIYMVGSKLSRFQLLTISTLFVLFALVFTFAAVSYLNLAATLLGENPGSFYFISQYVPMAIFFMQLAGIAAAIKFMVEIRSAAK